MAERMVRQLIDDLDGTEIADGSGERVVFTVRGETYQIDLTASNTAKLDRALKPFIDAAVKVRRETRRTGRETKPTRTPRQDDAAYVRRKVYGKGKGGVSTRMPKEQLAAIRDWARKNGYEPSSRGRIRSEIVEAFKAAH